MRQTFGQSIGLTRRGMLLLASGACLESWSRLYAGASDFWNKKEPSEWTSEEVDRLISKSPWAKEVVASPGGEGRGMGRRRGGMGYPGGGIGYPGGGVGYPGGGVGYPGGGVGYPGGGVGYPGGGYPPNGTGYPDDVGGGRGGSMQFKGVVRWESAKPILEALKTPLPAAFANHYVVSVSGIPILTQRRQSSGDQETDTTISEGAKEDVLERIKGLTYLEPKGKSPVQPGLVQQSAGGTRQTKTLLFGFSKDLLSLSPQDKEVTFTTQLGNVPVKAKFNLKEMTYRKTLAI